MIIMCHNVTTDDAVELRFENETIVVYKDNNCDLSGQEMQSYRTLDGRYVQCYGEHCNKISQFTWLKLFLAKLKMVKSFIKATIGFSICYIQLKTNLILKRCFVFKRKF